MAIGLWLVAMASAAEDGADWVVGRWTVVTETIDHNAPLVLTVASREFVAPAWQIHATLDCRPEGALGLPDVTCRIESAAVRVVTYDHWQRPRDRRRVQEMLEVVQERLEALPFRVRTPSFGRLDRVQRQHDANGLAVALLDDVLDTFYLPPPPTGLGPGARWRAGPDPLLRVPVDLTTARPDATVEHVSHTDGDWLVVETSADVERLVVADPRDRYAYRRAYWRTSNPPVADPKARRDALRMSVLGRQGSRPRKGQLTLRATSRLDPERLHLHERSWTVEGRGATLSWRAGRVRRLGADEVPEMSTTQQVADPNVRLNDLPPWLSIEERER